MAARLTQRHLTKLFALDEDLETVDNPTLQHFRPDVVAGAKPVGHDGTLHAGQQTLHAGVVAAHDVQPVERDLVHETDERLVDGFLIAVVIQMAAVHIGHDVDDRQQAEERAVGFVGFGDQILALPQPGVGPIGVDPSPDADCPVKAGGVENGGGQRSRGGLAVCPGNGDPGPQAHKLRQHLRTGNHRDTLLAGGDHFGIVFRNCAGLYQHVDVIHIPGGVPDMDIRPERAQTLNHGAVRHVRAVHFIAEVQKHFGNTAHARAADADHMDFRKLGTHHRFLFQL